MNNKWGLHVKEEGDYIYMVKKPNYLSPTGNLSVAKGSKYSGK